MPAWVWEGGIDDALTSPSLAGRGRHHWVSTRMKAYRFPRDETALRVEALMQKRQSINSPPATTTIQRQAGREIRVVSVIRASVLELYVATLTYAFFFLSQSCG